MSPAASDAQRARLLNARFHDYQGPPFRIRVQDWVWTSSADCKPVFSLVFRDTAAFHALCRNPTEAGLGESYVRGDLDVEGDLFSAIEMADYLFAQPLSVPAKGSLVLHEAFSAALDTVFLGRRHSRRRDRGAISYHYDHAPQFFRPWLGPSMAYSCAYFRRQGEDLDRAQANKMDLICRKLELSPDDSMLDIGCGWGSLAMHARANYGANTRGITLSKEQAHFAANRVAQAKMNDGCFIELRDYRDLPQLPYRYDKIASVGMFEHVGRKNLPHYFQIAHELLKPGGLFLNHGIARSYSSPPTKHSFIRKYVFPDGELVPISETVQFAEAAGFEVRDVDNLREHYALTLKLWVAGLEKNRATVLADVPESDYRIWLLYMAGSAVAFQRGDVGLYQILLRRPHQRSVARPYTREHWYADWNTGQRTRAA